MRAARPSAYRLGGSYGNKNLHHTAPQLNRSTLEDHIAFPLLGGVVGDHFKKCEFWPLVRWFLRLQRGVKTPEGVFRGCFSDDANTCAIGKWTRPTMGSS